jgi:hypothetical protein
MGPSDAIEFKFDSAQWSVVSFSLLFDSHIRHEGCGLSRKVCLIATGFCYGGGKKKVQNSTYERYY